MEFAIAYERKSRKKVILKKEWLYDGIFDVDEAVISFFSPDISSKRSIEFNEENYDSGNNFDRQIGIFKFNISKITGKR